MRYRLRTLLIAVMLTCIGLAWWRDRTRLVADLRLGEHRIRLLQRDLFIERQNGLPVASKLRFKTPNEAIAFLRSCHTHDDIVRNLDDWNAFGDSTIADDTIGPLSELLATSQNKEVRQFTIWLLGQIGRKKQPPRVDPVPALMAALDDSSSNVRAQAMDTLSKYGSLANAALPRLLEIMHRDRGHDAFLATLAVSAIDSREDVRPRLLELFKIAGVRGNVAHCLPEFFPPTEAKRMLTAQYEVETDNSTREMIAEAMNKIKE
jgi:hypothetical protein